MYGTFVLCSTFAETAIMSNDIRRLLVVQREISNNMFKAGPTYVRICDANEACGNERNVDGDVTRLCSEYWRTAKHNLLRVGTSKVFQR